MEKNLEESWNSYLKGDNSALEPIYNFFYFDLFNRAYRLLKDEEKSKDIVHDVFLKLCAYSLKDRMSKPSGSSFILKAYLLRAVRNRCLDFIDQETNRRTILDGVKDSIFQLFSRSLAEESFVEANYKEMLDMLPDRQREILQLHLDGYQNDEIAESLNLSYNTVRNQISTSKATIRSLWSTFMD